MKKVLIATTALVATAGVASAQGVALSGQAEMGIFGGDGVNESFFTDIDVTFTLSGETDNGLTFGAAVDLDEGGPQAAHNNNADDGGIAIFLSGNFGTVTMGDTDGALDWAMTEAWVGNAGSLADDETVHAGALGAYGDGAYDGQILRYDNTFGDFGVAVSVEFDDNAPGPERDTGFAIGFRYSFAFAGGSVDLGAGYQFIDAANFGPGSDFTRAALAGDDFDGEYNIYGISAAVMLDSGLSAGLTYTDFQSQENDDEGDHIGVGIGYTFDAFTVSANWGRFEIDHDIAPDETITGYGLAAAYDLGGGAAVHAGYGRSEFDGIDWETWSLGLQFNF